VIDGDDKATFILTAELDDDSFAWLDGLRRRHFPPERNFLSAHLTLFHKLSSTQVSSLRSLDAPAAPVKLYFDRIVFLGFGVAVHVESTELMALRKVIRATAGGELSRQDSQPWRPHVTIQNKASAKAAQELHRELEAHFERRAGTVTGILAWEYLGGPWKPLFKIPFG
jgi:2'-5' RNA ligase